MGLKPSALSTTGSGWCCPTFGVLRLTEPCDPGSQRRRLETLSRRHPTRRAPPAEVSRARGRRALAVRRLPSGWPALLRDAGSVTRASPQPDPPGHLMSRDRGATGGEPAACGRRSRRAGAVRLRRSRRARPALPREGERVGPAWPRDSLSQAGGGRGPLHPCPREEARDRLRPRCLPSMSHQDAGTRAFVRFRLSGVAFSTGCHQPVENARRRAIAGRPTLRPGCLDGQPTA